MVGNLVDEARDASAREMFDLLPIDLNLALADVAEGLEQLATPIVGMLKAQISLEWVDLCCNKIKLFLLFTEYPALEIVIDDDVVMWVLSQQRRVIRYLVHILVQNTQFFGGDGDC